MAQPQPGELDGDLPGPPVAGLADPLLMVDPTAAPGRGGQPEIAAQLAPVLEVLPEQLAGQDGGDDRADTLQALQQGGGLADLTGSGLAAERSDLLAQQPQTGVLRSEEHTSEL